MTKHGSGLRALLPIGAAATLLPMMVFPGAVLVSGLIRLARRRRTPPA